MLNVNLNAAQLTLDDLKRLRVPRNPQDNELRDAVANGLNVLVCGPRGSGKTFTLRALESDLSQDNTKFFPVEISVAHMMGQDPREMSTYFPWYVLLALCRALWGKVFSEKYSRLLELSALQDKKVVDDLRPRQKRFVEMYGMLQARQFDARASTKTMVGATAIARAEIGFERGASVSRGGLLPFEFQALLNEIMEICNEKSPLVPVIICDEANLFLVADQQLLISACFEIFNSVGIRFVCAFAKYEWMKDSLVPDAFQVAIGLEGFASAAETLDLIERHFLATGVAFDSANVDIIQEFFSGHPRATLDACASAAQSQIDAGDPGPVSAQRLIKACLEVQRRYEEGQKAWQARENQI